ncbi:MAG: bifunctional enoyl-CoA hydratase/phosphate acetyltransferase [Clostridiales bacterium]|nr:bifunctional enoyl-CoA hydratase/phosphate acetyltransferase [Clostridiales bacterium]
MEFQNIHHLLGHVRNRGQCKRLAIAAATDPHVLKAACRAYKENIANPFLIGDKPRMLSILEDLQLELPEQNLIHEPDVDNAARAAVALVREGSADYLMKGLLNTSNMLKAVLNHDNGLQRGGTLSHISINELPTYHKLLVVTDAGILIQPSLTEKVAIIRNAVGALHAMGYECPKVAVLAALEKVNPKMPETVDAAALKDMNISGELSSCIVEGPISMDLTLDPKAAQIKGFSSPVVGNADILVVPNIACGNILNKGLRYLANSQQVGIVLGAQVPIVLTSRSASAQSKYLSIAVTSAMI